VDVIPFLVMFVALFTLGLIKPGNNIDGTPKAKKPWLVMIGFIGIIYGLVCSYWIPSIKPTLIIDAFPSVTSDSIFNFSHYKAYGTTIPWSAIMIGSLKVAFVAIFETFISATIAQRKYD